MDWKAKARKHKKWVEVGRDIAQALSKYPNVGSLPFHVYYSGEMLELVFGDECFPKCNCKDDGDRLTAVTPHEMSNGEYQLRIICWVCTEMGKRAVKWDTVGEAEVIPFLNNYIPFATFVKYLKFVMCARVAWV